jgi:hypothetical protein
MVDNLTEESKKVIDNFLIKVKSENKLTIEQECLISISESLLILAEKIGRKLL